MRRITKDMINYPIRIIITVCLTIIIFAIAGCDRHNGASEKLDLAESLMDSRPDSALSILNAVNVETLNDKKDKARYALLKSMALDKNYIDTTSLDILQPAIDYYLRKGTADEKLRTYYYQGRIYQNRENNDSAMQSFMRGKEYFGQASDTMTMANLMVAQATILYSTYKFKDYICINLDAAKLYKAIGRTDYEMSCLANALDGSIITNDKQLADSILSVVELRARENEELRSSISPYILSYAVNFGNDQEVVDIIHHYDSIQVMDDIIKMDLAEVYCKIGDSYNAMRVINSIPSTSEHKTSLKYLALKPNVLELNGDFKGALEAYREFSITLSSVHQDIFSHDLLFAKERHEMEKSTLLKIQGRDRIIWLSLCLTFVLLIIAGYIYYRYRLRKAKGLLDEQENQRLQLEQENLKRENENLELRNHQAELEKQNLQQTNEKLELERHNAVLEKQKAELECERQSLAAENLRLKIEQLEDESASLKGILEKRKDLAKPIEEAIKIRIEMLNGLLAAQITDNNTYAKSYGDWRDKLIQDKDEFMNTTRLAFKASHPRFIEYLEDHGLTESEINYVCLYAIGLRGKEAGEYMQLKRHYNISSEIRGKLGLSEHNTNIGIYVRHLMKDL